MCKCIFAFLFSTVVVVFASGMQFDQKIHLTQPSLGVNFSPNILLFAGSLREASLNKKLIQETAYIADRLGANVQVINLKEYPIPFYDADEEAIYGMPENAKKIRDLMLQSHFIFIASPNYNKSFPAVLKNVLDWTSRSEDANASREAYTGKLFVLMSASSGAKGGIKGLPHLRTVIETIGGTVLAEEFPLSFADKAFEGEEIESKVRLEEFINKVFNN